MLVDKDTFNFSFKLLTAYTYDWMHLSPMYYIPCLYCIAVVWYCCWPCLYCIACIALQFVSNMQYLYLLQNQKRGEVQSSLNLFLETASGFYLHVRFNFLKQIVDMIFLKMSTFVDHFRGLFNYRKEGHVIVALCGFSCQIYENIFVHNTLIGI